MHSKLQRFEDAQQHDYAIAIKEIKNGQKIGHWMWYIFPQLKGLGQSPTTKYYGIQDLQEAADYLKHPVLGPRLVEISEALLRLPFRTPKHVFDSPDDLKLHSSMTLFSMVPGSNPVFADVLQKFFKGKKDTKTVDSLKGQSKKDAAE